MPQNHAVACIQRENKIFFVSSLNATISEGGSLLDDFYAIVKISFVEAFFFDEIILTNVEIVLADCHEIRLVEIRLY